MKDIEITVGIDMGRENHIEMRNAIGVVRKAITQTGAGIDQTQCSFCHKIGHLQFAGLQEG